MILFLYRSLTKKKTSFFQSRALRQVQYAVAMTVAPFHMIHETSDKTPDQIIQRED